MHHSIRITMYLYIPITSYLPFYLRPTAKAGGGEQAEVGRTRLFPLALRGKGVLRIPTVYFTPRLMLKRPYLVYLAVYQDFEIIETL